MSDSTAAPSNGAKPTEEEEVIGEQGLILNLCCHKLHTEFSKNIILWSIINRIIRSDFTFLNLSN